MKILTCKPGPKCFLDYNKSDLWASGSLFYEFFSQSNPFFHGQFQQDTYDDQNLPSLSSLTSPLLERLIHLILQKNPEKVFFDIFINIFISFLLLASINITCQ